MDTYKTNKPTCVICLETLTRHSACTIDPCAHPFHVYCLKKWARQRNLCPLCQAKFNTLIYKDRHVFVPDVAESAREEITFLEFLTGIYCQVCCLGIDEDLLLLCDKCNLAYHTYCLCPELSAVPEGDWFCLGCSEESEEETTAKTGMDLSDDESELFASQLSSCLVEVPRRRKLARTESSSFAERTDGALRDSDFEQ